ncbi:hypothetical protein SAMN04515671_2899 [Nakamurella panacisegetis]|uniref:Uncharacterized protein n=1 Tax=Nakamurella panacisegetis TaxID=1090615 RepID=A0A1H0PUT3_9ACTN|nr:hypothetical protein SAMN04515671_2899 [Nakamurella panacisegetis]
MTEPSAEWIPRDGGTTPPLFGPVPAPPAPAEEQLDLFAVELPTLF